MIISTWLKNVWRKNKGGVRKLPDKPSELITVALADLRKVERRSSNTYKINMGVWHEPFPEDGGTSQCSLCLAGSVMSASLGLPGDVSSCPSDWPVKIRNKLIALNSFRVGDVMDGLETLGLLDKAYNKLEGDDYTSSWMNRYHSRYQVNPRKFYKNMRKLARDLKEIGL